MIAGVRVGDCGSTVLSSSEVGVEIGAGLSIYLEVELFPLWPTLPRTTFPSKLIPLPRRTGSIVTRDGTPRRT